MRSFQLLRLAMDAEGLRLRLKGRRAFTRLVLGGFAIGLLLGAVLFGHVAAWYWLRGYMSGQYVALIFAGADLFLAAILAGLAASSSPGRAELEALEVRRRALGDAVGSLSIMTIAIRAVELFMSRGRR